MIELKDLSNTNTYFASMGAAWQWAVDVAALPPAWITQTASEIGLSEQGLLEICKRLMDQGRSAEDIKNGLKAKLVAERIEDYSAITTGFNLQAFREEIAENAKTPKYSTGFSNLDQALDGGLYKGLYIIGAVPSLGKTTFVLQMADQIAMQGKDVLIISLEMDRTELTAKSISRSTFTLAREAGRDPMAKTARDILDGSRYEQFSPSEITLIDGAFEHYSKYADHVYVIEGRGNCTVNEIRAAVDHHKNITGNAPVVIVDYIQIITPLDSKGTDKMNIDNAVRALFWIARDYNLPVIGISSFNRQNYKGRPSMAAFKESGSLEYCADVLLGMGFKGSEEDGYDALKAKRKDPREIVINILKNRLASVGGVLQFDYYAAYNTFVEDGYSAE